MNVSVSVKPFAVTATTYSVSPYPTPSTTAFLPSGVNAAMPSVPFSVNVQTYVASAEISSPLYETDVCIVNVSPLPSVTADALSVNVGAVCELYTRIIQDALYPSRLAVTVVMPSLTGVTKPLETVTIFSFSLSQTTVPVRLTIFVSSCKVSSKSISATFCVKVKLTSVFGGVSPPESFLQPTKHNAVSTVKIQRSVAFIVHVIFFIIFNILQPPFYNPQLSKSAAISPRSSKYVTCK